MLNGERILIVEDEVLIGISLEGWVRDAGNDAVVLATTVQEALLALEVIETTLAVLDVNLGGETSLAVARKLSGDGIPFVYHTSRSPADLSCWPEAPIVGKPDCSNELVASLEALALRSDQLQCNHGPRLH